MSIDFGDPRIQELIRQQVAAQLAEQSGQPAAPKELTSEEKTAAALDAVDASLARDGNRVSDHLVAIVAALRALFDHVNSSKTGSSSENAPIAPGVTNAQTVGTVGADDASSTVEEA